ncbi:MAG TPA: phosphotransferase [Actinomycetota bacterium]|nr:phosphotransferase [Actinomycetota bacterium]
MRPAIPLPVRSRPRVEPGEARGVLARLWGIEAELEPLPSERDRNFLVRVGGEPRFVLKISNAREDPLVLDLQHRAAERLLAGGVPVPRVVPIADGREVAEERGHLVRLLTYLPGRPMAELRPPRPPALLRDLGRTCGRAAAALEGFSHPADRRYLHWDVRHARRVIEACAPAVPEGERRELVLRTLARFRREALPRLALARTGVVHDDANDHNVLVDEAGERVVGLLDLGDLVRTWVVNDAAVACAYAMLGEETPLEAAAHVVRGYEEAFPLEGPEREAVLDLIRIRLATSVAISAQQHREAPEDAYLTVSEERAWDLLRRLDRIEPGAPLPWGVRA